MQCLRLPRASRLSCHHRRRVPRRSARRRRRAERLRQLDELVGRRRSTTTASTTTTSGVVGRLGREPDPGPVHRGAGGIARHLQGHLHARRARRARPRRITIEQKPPKSVFSTSSGSVINDGTHTYFCTTTGGKKQCVSESGAGVNPLASITTLFSPTTLLNEFHAAEAAAGCPRRWATAWHFSNAHLCRGGTPSASDYTEQLVADGEVLRHQLGHPGLRPVGGRDLRADGLLVGAPGQRLLPARRCHGRHHPRRVDPEHADRCSGPPADLPSILRSDVLRGQRQGARPRLCQGEQRLDGGGMVRAVGRREHPPVSDPAVGRRARRG